MRYFQAANATGGSFVRLAKVDTGISLPEAVTARYREEGALGRDETDPNELYVPTVGQRRVNIELVGRDKVMRQQGRLHTLVQIYVPDSRVSHMGKAGDLGAICPAAELFDLSGNLLRGQSEGRGACRHGPVANASPLLTPDCRL